jgi:hypothetical protein
MPLDYGDCSTLALAMFQSAQLGDRRRAARAVKVFEALRRHPGGSLPVKFAAATDLKALYRLCDCDEVTHEALLSSMRAHPRRNVASHSGTVLLLHDTTELSYTSRITMADDLGQIGDGQGRLGGHQNRRHDHPHGWLVHWRGWTKLQSMLLGHNVRTPQRCG